MGPVQVTEKFGAVRHAATMRARRAPRNPGNVAAWGDRRVARAKGRARRERGRRATTPGSVRGVKNARRAASASSRVKVPASRPAAGRSLESHHLPPQFWETPEVRETLFADDDAMRVARAVLATGVVLAAALRSFYVRQHPPGTRAEVQVLEEAIRRVGLLLSAPQGMPNRCVRHAPGACAMSGSPAA